MSRTGLEQIITYHLSLDFLPLVLPLLFYLSLDLLLPLSLYLPFPVPFNLLFPLPFNLSGPVPFFLLSLFLLHLSQRLLSHKPSQVRAVRVNLETRGTYSECLVL